MPVPIVRPDEYEHLRELVRETVRRYGRQVAAHRLGVSRNVIRSVMDGVKVGPGAWGLLEEARQRLAGPDWPEAS